MKQRNRSKLKRENVSPKILTAIFCAGRIRETFEIVKSKKYIYIHIKGKVHKFIQHFICERISLFLTPLLVEESWHLNLF